MGQRGERERENSRALLSLFLYDLKGKVTQREESEKEIFHLLSHSLSVLNGQGWSRRKTGV